MQQPSRTAAAILAVALVSGSAWPQTSQDPPPSSGTPGAGKILGLPTPKADRERREGALVLPRGPGSDQEGVKDPATPSSPITEASTALADFVDTLLTKKPLSTEVLIAEFMLLGDNDKRTLAARAHRLPGPAIARLSSVYRALNDIAGLPALLTVLNGRQPGSETAQIVADALFLAGSEGKRLGLQLLESRYNPVRTAAATNLVPKLDSGDLGAVRGLVNHGEQGTRLAALQVLAHWLANQPDAGVEPLASCLHHKDGAIRSQAARHLLERGAAVESSLLQIAKGQPEDEAFFLAALVLARRELATDHELLPPTCLEHLAVYRERPDPMRRGVATATAGLRFFRQPVGQAAKSPLERIPFPELVDGLLSAAEVQTYYPEFPVVQDAALLALRLLLGLDYGTDASRWRAWWAANKGSATPLRSKVLPDVAAAGKSRLSYRVSGVHRLVLLGPEAEPPSSECQAVLRLKEDDLVDLLNDLVRHGLFDLPARITDQQRLPETHEILVESPDRRARDAFPGERSPRLLALTPLLTATAERESWQEYAPRLNDATQQRTWWLEQRAKLGKAPDAERNDLVLDLAVAALPTLEEAPRRRALGRLLAAVAAPPGRLAWRHAEPLLALLRQRSLNDQDTNTLFEVVARVEPDHFGAVLDALAAQKTPNVQQLLARVLTLAGPLGIVPALTHPDIYVRAAAATEAANVPAARAVAPLLAALDDAEPEVRLRAAESCGKLRLLAAQPKLEALLDGTDAGVRRAALIAIARLGAPGAYETLLRAVGPGDAVDRLNAVRGLTLLEDPRASLALVDFAVAHYGTPVGLQALQGLQTRGGETLRREMLRRLQASDNSELRKEFVFLLAEMHDPSTFRTLLEALERGESAVRCCRLLAQMTGMDWCAERDRVKKYRDFWQANADKSQAIWLMLALQEAKIATKLGADVLVSGAPFPVIDELCRLVESAADRHWAIRCLASNMLRELTQQDFGSVTQATNLGARQAIAERYRAWSRANERR